MKTYLTKYHLMNIYLTKHHIMKISVGVEI